MAEVEISYKRSNIATMNASGTKTLLTEGKYLEDDVTVEYTRPSAPSGTKNISITANGQTTEDVAAYASAQITANVPNTYSAGDEGKVVSNGALVAQGSDTVTQNDTYDTTLISSLTVNVSGGNIGGLTNMTDIIDPEYSPAFMLSAMKNGNTAGGKITVGQLPNTETLLIETGLQQVHGFILTAPTYNMASSVSGTSAKHFIAFGRNFSGTITFFAVSQTVQNTVGTANAYQNGAKNENAPINGYLRIDGGDIYYTARYNKNGAYQLIKNAVEYEWLAW